MTAAPAGRVPGGTDRGEVQSRGCPRNGSGGQTGPGGHGTPGWIAPATRDRIGPSYGRESSRRPIIPARRESGLRWPGSRCCAPGAGRVWRAMVGCCGRGANGLGCVPGEWRDSRGIFSTRAGGNCSPTPRGAGCEFVRTHPRHEIGPLVWRLSRVFRALGARQTARDRRDPRHVAERPLMWQRFVADGTSPERRPAARLLLAGMLFCGVGRELGGTKHFAAPRPILLALGVLSGRRTSGPRHPVWAGLAWQPQVAKPGRRVLVVLALQRRDSGVDRVAWAAITGGIAVSGCRSVWLNRDPGPWSISPYPKLHSSALRGSE